MRAIITGEDVGTTIDFRTVGPYEAQHPWPEETVVSAGGGVVFIRNPKPDARKSYTSLFMEVYPPGAGFIRGEGATPEECEDAAWAKYQLAIFCSDGRGVHMYVPRDRTDGAAFCMQCETFASRVFTGEQLGQHCKVCGAGTTYHSKANAAGEMEFLCKNHYVRPERHFAEGIHPMQQLLNELFSDDDAPAPTQNTTASHEHETSNPDE